MESPPRAPVLDEVAARRQPWVTCGDRYPVGGSCEGGVSGSSLLRRFLRRRALSPEASIQQSMWTMRHPDFANHMPRFFARSGLPQMKHVPVGSMSSLIAASHNQGPAAHCDRITAPVTASSRLRGSQPCDASGGAPRVTGWGVRLGLPPALWRRLRCLGREVRPASLTHHVTPHGRQGT